MSQSHLFRGALELDDDMDAREAREDRLDAIRARRILKQAQQADAATRERHTMRAVSAALNAASARRPYCPVRACTIDGHDHDWRAYR